MPAQLYERINKLLEKTSNVCITVTAFSLQICTKKLLENDSVSIKQCYAAKTHPLI